MWAVSSQSERPTFMNEEQKQNQIIKKTLHMR